MKPHCVEDVIRMRRSLKPDQMDHERPVERALLLQLLECARWAPTHGMTQPWRFHIFRETESRASLARALTRLYQELTPEEAVRPEKLRKLERNPLLASAVLVIALHRDRTRRIPEWEEIASVACAVQNLALSAAAGGLGGYWSTPPIIHSPEMASFLGLDPEKGDRCLGLFYLGWPEKGLQLESRRSAVEESVIWH